MQCCECVRENDGWADRPEVVYDNRKEGKAYCVFHAPKDLKRKELDSDKLLTLEEFNAKVFDRIDKVNERREAGDAAAWCDLRRTVFPGEINFFQYTPANPLPVVDFRGAVFSANVYFSNTLFSGQSWFQQATFTGAAIFETVEFGGGVLFGLASFLGEALFRATKINKFAVFDGARFEGPVKFDRVSFDCTADLRGVTFKKGTRFYETDFSAGADFDSARFEDECRFRGAHFGAAADFRNMETAKEGRLRMLDIKPASLGHLVFSSEEAPSFTFRNCKWPDRLGLENHPGKTGPSLLELEELYRAMKQRADSEHDRSQVSHWHFQEKLMQLRGLVPDAAHPLVDDFESPHLGRLARLGTWWRLFRALPWPRWRSLLFLYWTTSGFGERPNRAAVCLLALAGVSLPLFLGLKIIETWPTGQTPLRPDFGRLLEALSEWLRCMPLVKLDYQPDPDAPIIGPLRFFLNWFFQAAITVQAGLFALAVRNRFRR